MPRCWNTEIGGHLSALIAAVTPLDAPADIRAVHRTYLAEPGRKADLKTPKMALGSTRGMGVVLGHIGGEVCVAEGIESALSAGEHLGLPAVATLGASGMTELIMPGGVRRIVIAFDCDQSGAGERAARALALRLYAEGREVFLRPPPDSFCDWNDFAQAQAREAAHG